MKLTTFLVLFSVLTSPVLAADLYPKYPLVVADKKFLYSDFVVFHTGGRSDHHYCLVHADHPDFSGIGIVSPEEGKATARVLVGKELIPIKEEGVYLARVENGKISIQAIRRGNPNSDDKQSVELFIEEAIKKQPNQPLQRNASNGSVSNFESPARRG
jgi:hypothetical protein